MNKINFSSLLRRKLDNPKIRTYWEKVETPIKFDDNYFKFLI